jgi:hypothetical protein
MADDQMRMKAQLINEVSGPVKAMQRDMQAFVKATKDLQAVFNKYGKENVLVGKGTKDNVKQMGLLRREFEGLKNIVHRVSPAFGEVSSEVGKLNLGAGALIGTMAAVGYAMYEGIKHTAEFADKMRQLKFAARETGLAAPQLKQLQLAAEQFGISGDQMTESMYGFADAMTRVHQQDAGFLNSIRPASKYTQELVKMGFEGKGTADELEALFRAMDKIKKEHPGVVGQQLSRSLAGMFGVRPELSRLSLDEFKKLMADIKELGFDPFRLKQAEKDAAAFNTELNKTKIIMDAWGTAIEANLLKPMTMLIHDLNQLMSFKMPDQGLQSIFRERLGLEHTIRGPSDVPDSAPVKSRAPWTAKGLPKFAEGAVVTQPTIAQIGEKGPEAVIPLTGGGFDPFVMMQLMIEDVFGNKRGGGYALTGGGGAGGKMAALAGMGVPIGPSSISRGSLGKTFGGLAGTGPLFRRGVGPRARRSDHDVTPLPEVGQADLAADRKAYAEELARNPALAQRMAQISLGENRNPQANLAVIETIMNRASVRRTSLAAQMRSVNEGGYYPPSTFAGGAGGLANQKASDLAYANIRRALGGSNMSNYATDNSSQGLAYSERFGGSMGGYGRPGQAPGKFTFQSEFGGKGTGTPGTETFFSPGWGGGREGYEKWRKTLADRAAVDRAAVNGAMGTSAQKIEGAADLNVKVTAPPGTSVSSSSSGIFQRPNIERNIQMMPSSSGPAQGISGFDQPM